MVEFPVRKVTYQADSICHHFTAENLQVLKLTLRFYAVRCSSTCLLRSGFDRCQSGSAANGDLRIRPGLTCARPLSE